MSIHEKSAWACLAAILVAFVPYFAAVLLNPGFPVVVPAFIGAVGVLVAILTVVHIFFAVRSARIRRTGDFPPPDEREVGIELRSTKLAAYVLAAVVMTWCLAAYVGIPLSRIRQQQAVAQLDQAAAAARPTIADEAPGEVLLSNLLPVPAHDALLFVHLLFGGFVLANVVYYAALVVGYRRSA